MNEKSTLSLDVLYQFNNKYAPYAGTSITSLLENNKHFGTLNIHILDDSMDPISSENRGKIKLISQKYNRSIIIYNTDELVAIMKRMGIPQYRGSYSTNMKMFVSEILPKTISRLLYIDSDTIIVGKLDELASLEFDNNYLAMVLDTVGYKHKLDIGMSWETMYFNAGVILFNYPLWIAEKCVQQIINHVETVRAHYPAPDQDLINITMKNRIKCLKMSYNLQPIHYSFSIDLYLKNYVLNSYYSRDEIIKALDEPIIIHCFRFLGEFPWHDGNLHPNSKKFDYYLRESEWKDYIKQKADVSLVLKVEKMLYKLLPNRLFIKVFKIAHRRFLVKANKLSLMNKNDKNM